ncbi:hypothetical protein VCRA2110O2_20163 [Vibrio crassostreae]|nr:hypothetical protein VCRA2110O2_20163 [Vibrio crassostreae]
MVNSARAWNTNDYVFNENLSSMVEAHIEGKFVSTRALKSISTSTKQRPVKDE